MKKELTQRDIPYVAAAIVTFLLLIGGGIFIKQRVDDSHETQRMNYQMVLEMGRNPELADENSGPVETVEQQSDPYFKP